ncbi:YybH family protein [Roseateles toxinivorans]|uniref:Ketosteroid isomerase-like protein n=1 Tax=Roseateles toxinivorans TaxID=270368 RepID=A0A4R6QQV6_9BURK|nr:nuclear transport factor 2 family protein [Roseateles toxinivorans]TDP72535.1 ketosteroid isomerase-like protein [Roseateles toxinivorans]
MSELDKDIARILGVYESAVFKKDVEALMRLYDPEVRVFDAWGVWSYEGAEAWQRTVEGWFTSLGTERVKVSFADVQAFTGKDMASVSAIVTYAGVSAEGQPLRAMQNRISWVLRTTGHVPRIVHEHTSAPIGFEDSKAILVRDKA